MKDFRLVVRDEKVFEFLDDTLLSADLEVLAIQIFIGGI